MRINWKIRAQNPQFWIQLALAIAVPVGAYFGITGADLTTWGTVGHYVMEALRNPYVLGTVVVSVYNALTDPTSPGVFDSARALTYRRPGGDA